MEGLRFNIYEGFGTEDDMLKYFKTKAFFDNVTVLAGVVFHMNDDGSLPNHMIYKIRQNASFTRETDRVRSRFWFPGPGASIDNYYRFGFTWIQVLWNNPGNKTKGDDNSGVCYLGCIRAINDRFVRWPRCK